MKANILDIVYVLSLVEKQWNMLLFWFSNNENKHLEKSHSFLKVCPLYFIPFAKLRCNKVRNIGIM